jgi:hypothetical protein
MVTGRLHGQLRSALEDSVVFGGHADELLGTGQTRFDAPIVNLTNSIYLCFA